MFFPVFSQRPPTDNTHFSDRSLFMLFNYITTYQSYQKYIGLCNGFILNIKTIWIVTEKITKFVTLFPAQER
ncbi:MAG: hypothetical protein F6K17_40925 [Okeania sp. SIO3C4]|nr:hypothetical protein [Okeania sp. SIO3C4]